MSASLPFTKCICGHRKSSTTKTNVKMPKRSSAAKVPTKGILTGAKVVRGPDWDWGNQDGGEGKPGKVLDIRGWDSESGRSVANIMWMSGSTNVYRLGHKGKVDLKYIEEATGGTYYKDQLPVLGETNESAPSTMTHHQFKVRDKVRVDLEMEILKAMQEGHGGWNPRMGEYIGKIGTVHRITERGDVRVQYEGCGNRWTFHPGALTKVENGNGKTVVCQFSVGDIVQILENAAQVKDLQRGHGEWTENMKAALGKCGKVLKVYTDGDLRVSIGSQIWTFNPGVCQMLPHGQQDENNTLTRTDREEPGNTLEAILEHLLDVQTPASEPDRLVREAAQGHLDVIREILAKHPEKVDHTSSGKSALQVASHQGHLDIVHYLLVSGACLELPDEDGDTALHYSAFGNQADVTELLLKKGAKIDARNNAGCSMLHVAVNKQHTKCVRVLLRHKCDVNIKDSYGDTALHDAIGKDSQEIVDMLVCYPGIDFTLKNKRGFNVLHHAALKGNNQATESILQKTRQIVDAQKDDGFAALHLAALNGHLEVVNMLITVGKADLERTNNRKQTPLLLAVSPWTHGHPAIVELLVTKGARVTVQDEDGNTCLHLALMRPAATTVDLTQAPGIAKIHVELSSDLGADHVQVGLSMACFLASSGADLRMRNHHRKSALDLAADPKVIEILKRYARLYEDSHPSPPPAPTTDPSAVAAPECLVCSDLPADVTFDPCGHKVVCSECCVRMKKCFLCKMPIQRKVGAGALDPDRSVRELQRRMQEMEDTLNCSICLENPRTVAFLCGHSACTKCAQPLKICHMCRKPISRKINLFN